MPPPYRFDLDPGEISFPFGTVILANDVNNVVVNIISTSTGGGKHLTSAKFVVEFEIDPSLFNSFDTKNIPPAENPTPGYQLSGGELGFLTSDVAANPKSIADNNVSAEATFTMDANHKFLNLKLPVIFTKKRDNGD